MAYLATLEGEGEITIDDLFDVNDFLGVRFFGVDKWNRIKDFACKLTETAANSPIMFCIGHVDRDYSKPSTLSCALLGFNDHYGKKALGSTAWNTLKCRLDDELLGWGLSNIKNAASKVASGVTSAAKTAVSLPNKAIDVVINETPLQYTPAAYVYNNAINPAYSAASGAVSTGLQKTGDLSSKILYTAATETPLKYTPVAKMVAALETTKEKAGVTSQGTTGALETDAEKEAKRKAMYSHAAQATQAAVKKENEDRAVQVATNELNRQINAAQAEQAATQKALDVMEERVTSKYAPIVIAGAFGLLALSILRK